MQPTSPYVAKSQTTPELPVVPPFPIQDLPYEIFCRVLGWLSPDDRGPFPFVCSYWKFAIDDITPWEIQQKVTTRLMKLRTELISLNTCLGASCGDSLQKHLLKIEAFLNAEDVEVTPQMLELDRETIDQIAEEWSCLPLEKVIHLQACTQEVNVSWLPTLFDLTSIFVGFHQEAAVDIKLHVILELIEEGYLDTALNTISKLEREITKVIAINAICKKPLSKEQIDKILVIARNIKLGQGVTQFHHRASVLMNICASLQLSRKQVDLVVMAVQEEIGSDHYKLAIISEMKNLKLTKEQVDTLLEIIKKTSAPYSLYLRDHALRDLCTRPLQAQQIDMILEVIQSAVEHTQWQVLENLFMFNAKSINGQQMGRICEMIHTFRDSDWKNALLSAIAIAEMDLEQKSKG